MAEVTGGGTTMARAAALVFCALIAGCAGGGGGGDDSDGGNQVQITPDSATLPAGGQMQFSGPSGSAAWSVENIPGGSSSVGTVSPTGLYLAPVRVPSPNTVADPNETAGVTVSVPGAANPAAVTLVSRFEVSTFDTCEGFGCPSDFPNAIAMADLNNDTRSDIVTGNTASGTISVLLSTGASTFAPPDRYDIGDPSKLPEPQALVATPVNNADTLVDIVIADASLQEPAVRTHLGNGDGTVQQTGLAQVLTGPNYPLAMASGQFNDDDAYPDVVVTNFLASTVMVLLGSPNGQFQAQTEVLTGQTSGPLGVAAGDFNHDGSDDIAVASSATAELVVGINDRNGAFPSPESYPIPGSPSAVAAADLNSDTYLDLLVTDAAGDTLTVLLNQGAATPGSFQAATPLDTGLEPVAVMAADFNGDGAVDAAVVNRQGGTVKTYFGHNDGTLTPAETYRVGSGPRAVAVGDVDGNGWFDLAVVNSGDDTVSVLRNRGAPTTP